MKRAIVIALLLMAATAQAGEPNQWLLLAARQQRPAAPAAAFSDIPGLVAWWDAADAASITLSGSNVVAWTDKISSLVASNTATLQPIYWGSATNGYPALWFDGVDDFFYLGTAQLPQTNATYVMVWDRNGAVVSVGFGSTSTRGTPINAIADWRVRQSFGTQIKYATNTSQGTFYYLTNGIHYAVATVTNADNTTSTLRLDGQELVFMPPAGTTSDMGPLNTIGAFGSTRQQGFLFEVAVWSRKLATNEIAYIEAICAGKRVP